MDDKDRLVQDMRRDLLWVMRHPMQSCKVCAFRDRDCAVEGCTPRWQGDAAGRSAEYGKEFRK